MPSGPLWPPAPPMSSDSEEPPMTRILHILTRPQDPVIDRLIQDQRQQPDHEIVVVSLTSATPDYDRLLDEVFRADSIANW